MYKHDVMTTVFISQTMGDDSYNGLSPERDENGNAPVKSIERALGMIKKMRAEGVDHRIFVSVIGDYYLSAPVSLSEIERVTIEPFGKMGRIS